MALATLRPIGGSESVVVRGAITMPRNGAWVAVVHVDTQDKPAGKVQISAGALTLLGTVNRATVYGGITRVRVVAGGDGLRKTTAPKHYTSPVLELPLRELAAGAGETVSSTSDPAALRTQLRAWTTIAMETGAMIEGLVSLAPAGTQWRMLADGSIWVGPETWPESGIKDARELDENPEEASVVMATDVPRIIPGTVVNGRRVDYVEHKITPEEYRAKVWIAAS